MYYITKYVEQILDSYLNFTVMFDTIPIGFVGSPGEKPAPAKSHVISQDALYFAPQVDFQNPKVRVRIQSISPQYNWMANNDPVPVDTPISCVAGFYNQVMPYIPLISPFFVKRQGQFTMQFTNDITTPVVGGEITWALLRLTNPINGGWDYEIGFNQGLAQQSQIPVSGQQMQYTKNG